MQRYNIINSKVKKKEFIYGKCNFNFENLQQQNNFEILLFAPSFPSGIKLKFRFF